MAPLLSLLTDSTNSLKIAVRGDDTPCTWAKRSVILGISSTAELCWDDVGAALEAGAAEDTGAALEAGALFEEQATSATSMIIAKTKANNFFIFSTPSCLYLYFSSLPKYFL